MATSKDDRSPEYVLTMVGSHVVNNAILMTTVAQDLLENHPEIRSYEGVVKYFTSTANIADVVGYPLPATILHAIFRVMKSIRPERFHKRKCSCLHVLPFPHSNCGDYVDSSSCPIHHDDSQVHNNNFYSDVIY